MEKIAKEITMKTLDEVINELHYWDTCDEFPESFYDFEITRDALYHLNKYRMTLDDIVAKRKALEAEIDRYQEAVKNCEEAENKYRKAEQDALKSLDDWASKPVEENKKLALTVDNPPLDWEQLKGMEGKPVWVESSDSFNRRRWMFVGEWFDDDEMRLFDIGNDYPDYVSKNGYESGTWQAYRKERG